MKHVIAAIAMLSLVGMARQVHAGACAPRSWKASILSPTGKAIPSDGAIVVGVTSINGDSPNKSSNPAIEKWMIGEGKSATPLVATAVAPGIARYTWGATKAGTHKITGEKGQAIGEIEIGTGKAVPLAAPAVKSVHNYTSTWTSQGGPYPGQKHTSHHVVVRLAAAPPADALGLVLYVGQGSKARPGLFTRVGSKSLDLQMYSSPGRCQPHLGGQIQPSSGGKVTTAWLGRGGTLSAQSPAVVVSAKAPGSAPAPVAKSKATPGKNSKPKKSKKGCAIGGRSGPGSLGLLLVVVGLLATRRRH